MKDGSNTTSSGLSVPPLVLEALKLVWKQHEDLEKLKKETYPKAVAEILSERECTQTVWEVYEEMTDTLLMDFPTLESMRLFLPRLRHQHGRLTIKERKLGRPKKC